MAALRTRHDAVLAELAAAPGAAGAGMVLHGDAHAGNLLRSGGQWPGPRHWDLAVLARSPMRR